MKFKEGLYYFSVIILLMAIVYVFIFKTELLINKWFIGGIVTIVLLILRQLYKWMVEKNGN